MRCSIKNIVLLLSLAAVSACTADISGPPGKSDAQVRTDAEYCKQNAAPVWESSDQFIACMNRLGDTVRWAGAMYYPVFTRPVKPVASAFPPPSAGNTPAAPKIAQTALPYWDNACASKKFPFYLARCENAIKAKLSTDSALRFAYYTAPQAREYHRYGCAYLLSTNKGINSRQAFAEAVNMAGSLGENTISRTMISQCKDEGGQMKAH